MKQFPKCQMHCLFFTASTMWGTGLVISFPGCYLNKQPMNKAREGKSILSPPALKLLQIPTLKCHFSVNTENRRAPLYGNTPLISLQESQSWFPRTTEATAAQVLLQAEKGGKVCKAKSKEREDHRFSAWPHKRLSRRPPPPSAGLWPFRQPKQLK